MDEQNIMSLRRRRITKTKFFNKIKKEIGDTKAAIKFASVTF